MGINKRFSTCFFCCLLMIVSSYGLSETSQNESLRPSELSEYSIPSKPAIITRKQWKAKKTVGKMKRQVPNKITIHHTASKQLKNRNIGPKLRWLQRFSQKKSLLANGKMKPAWADIPYHYYIDYKGIIAEGRDVNFAGDTNTDYDTTNHIQIVLEGNFENQEPTSEQLVSMKKIIVWLANKWQISPREIKDHNDYAETACPGNNLEPKIVELRNAIQKMKIE